MKLMNLFSSKEEVAHTALAIEDIAVGQTYELLRNTQYMRKGETATVVATQPRKVTFATEHGQYSMLPGDFCAYFMKA